MTPFSPSYIDSSFFSSVATSPSRRPISFSWRAASSSSVFASWRSACAFTSSFSSSAAPFLSWPFWCFFCSRSLVSSRSKTLNCCCAASRSSSALVTSFIFFLCSFSKASISSFAA